MTERVRKRRVWRRPRGGCCALLNIKWAYPIPRLQVVLCFYVWSEQVFAYVLSSMLDGELMFLMLLRFFFPGPTLFSFKEHSLDTVFFPSPLFPSPLSPLFATLQSRRMRLQAAGLISLYSCIMTFKKISFQISNGKKLHLQGFDHFFFQTNMNNNNKKKKNHD